MDALHGEVLTDFSMISDLLEELAPAKEAGQV